MWLFGALLYLYPASWRAEYGSEMRAVFARRLADASGPLAWLAVWAETLPDLLTAAPAVQWDVIRQDVRFAMRTLRHSPGFALTATAIAAMGIGTATASFTMIDHVLLRPLGFHDPDRLVKIWEDYSARGGGRGEASPANYRDWKRMSTSFEAMGAYRGLSVDMSGDGEPEQVEGASVTADVFPLLGVSPALGRYFRADEDRDSAPGTVVLSYGLWEAHFGGNAAVLGRTIDLDNQPYTIIGIMPRDFYFPNREARLWTAMRWPPDIFEDRLNTYIYPVARLKPGVRLEQARAEMRAIGARLARAYPKEMAKVSAFVVPLSQEVSPGSVLALKVLLAAALCVLLIACTNLAGMLLARAMSRRRELAVRAALGAGRERLLRQIVTESLLLAWSGAALGILLAHYSLPLFVRLVPTSLPIPAVPAIDGRVLAFAVAVTCATGLVFGLTPGLEAGRGRFLPELRGRSATGVRREPVRSTLVAVEIAASVVLLVGCGLLTRALWRIEAVDPGFRTDHLLTLRTSLPMPRYERTETREIFYRRVLEQAQSLPGVTGAAYISFLPIAMGGGIWPVGVEDHPQDIAERETASLRFVTPGYFAAMRIPLLAGRDVREADGPKAPYVAVVSHSFVRRYWPRGSALGRHVDIGNHDRVIIGVVADIRVRGLERTSEPQVYGSWRQPEGVSTWYAPKDLVVRSTVEPASLAPALRHIIREADPAQPISDVRTMEEVVEEQTVARRTQLYVLGAFAAMAFLLAATGIHGLLAFAVSTRTQEIGIRVALGARPGAIIRMTLEDALRLAAIGVAAGSIFAYAGGRVLESLLAGVKPDDPAAFAAAGTLAIVMVVAGSLLPVTRALRIDPATAIRTE